VRFSHPDHLRSAAVVTDAAGELVEETAFHPFGLVRNEQRWRSVEEIYKYTQKERDKESGLHYYEARYLAASLARFSRPDTKYATLDSLSKQDMDSMLVNPQSLNPYAYVRNNPIKFIDPQGEDAVKPRTDQVSYSLTLKSAGSEAVDLPIASVNAVVPALRSGNGRQNPTQNGPIEFHVTREFDNRSNDLIKDYMSGKVFEEATLTIRGPGKNREELFQIRLKNASITSIAIGSTPSSGGLPTENIVITETMPSDSPSKAAATAAPAEPQATRAGNPSAPAPAFDVDKAAKQTARDFQQILGGSPSK
jgi:RHS repeat-associated protein